MIGAESHRYDPAGNLILTRVFSIKGVQINGQNLELDSSYRLIRWTTFNGTETIFQYDPNGNLTEIKKDNATTKFEYDALDRLTAVVTPEGQRLSYAYQPGERSLIEQYEHADVNVADLRDTGFTFSNNLTVIATRPLNAGLGSIRFSESLGTFQLANANGSEIIRPHETIENAFSKLHLYQPGMSQKALQSGFSAPFNTMFIPAEYSTINCCPECYYDGEEWYCPPCSGGGTDPGLPDHLMVLSDVTQAKNCGSLPTCVERDITYAIVDINENQLLQVFVLSETFDNITLNSCGNGFPNTNFNCTGLSSLGQFTDHLTVGCNSVGGSCGLTATNQRWIICDIFSQPIGSPGTLVAHSNLVTVGGTFFFVPGTDIFP